jgi:propanol-preferring alcohol dehydrogenase
MRAARLQQGRNHLSVEEIDKPLVGSRDVLVNVRAASICGSDDHHLSGELPIEDERRPLTLGHEGAGIVVETGDTVTSFEEGDRVTINYVISCGNCDPCLRGYDNRCRSRKSIGSDLDGTFAEYIVLPARSAIKLPEAISYELGSIASCAISTAFHAVERAELEKGDTVVVFGVGGVGLHAVLLASLSLSQTVIAVDPLDAKLDVAEEYGADVTINPDEENATEVIRRLTDGYGADVTLECSGSPLALEQAIEAINGTNRFASGTAVSVGYQPSEIKATYWGLREGQLLVAGDHTRSELRRLMKLLESKRLNLTDSISSTTELGDINDSIDQVNNGTAGRLIVEP